MSDHPPAPAGGTSAVTPDDANIVWEKLTTEDGRAYEIGRPKSDDEADEPREASVPEDTVTDPRDKAVAEDQGAKPGEALVPEDENAKPHEGFATEALVPNFFRVPTSGTIQVEWQVASSLKYKEGTEPWISTSEEVRHATGITRYRLYGRFDYAWEVTYTLEFTNQVNYNYRFRDASGNLPYLCTTMRKGDHWVKYWSDKPTIVSIEYSYFF